MTFRITTLVENHVSKSNLLAEHGLSYLVESDEIKILVDLGQSAIFDENAKQLGCDISKIDHLIISHGHYDHVGGLSHFVENNNKANIYHKQNTFLPKYHDDRYIGVSSNVNIQNSRFKAVDEIIELASGFFIVPHINSYYKQDSHKANFYVGNENTKVADDFNDELFIVVDVDDKLTVLSSCSHNGITNMVETAKELFRKPVTRVLGGFHLKHATPEVIEHIGAYFENGNQEVYTGHCTGLDAYDQFKIKLGNRVKYMETGTVIDL